VRIISGSARGRKLDVPKVGTRPTSDRLREAMFSAIDSYLAQNQVEWPRVNFVDLFAGSGAIGLEAKSRGAGQVTLVENNSKARANIENNAARCGLNVRIVSVDAYFWVPTFKVDIFFWIRPTQILIPRFRNILSKCVKKFTLGELCSSVNAGLGRLRHLPRFPRNFCHLHGSAVTATLNFGTVRSNQAQLREECRCELRYVQAHLTP